MQPGYYLYNAELLWYIAGSTITTTPTTTLTLTTSTCTTTSTTTHRVDEKGGADTFLRGGCNYATLQPATKRSVGTETDAAELDHYSDDEAPLASPRGVNTWVSINVIIYNSGLQKYNLNLLAT
jgi:hypothetical protein